MSTEFVYIFTNPAMPDWIKVGRTNDVKRRRDELSGTSVPFPFECFAYLEVPSKLVSNVEKGLHDLLGRSFDKEKEFFKSSPDKVLDFFRNVRGYNPSFKLFEHPDLDAPLDKKKLPATNFQMLQIPVGAVLSFDRDDSVTCTVADSTNQVIFQGQRYALSALACELLHYSVNGYRVFVFEGETLWERRLRLSD